jgi:C1A family cysteine protease
MKQAKTKPPKQVVKPVYKMGWLPDLPDARDFMYAAPLKTMLSLPAKTDLSKKCPIVYQQGNLGSCTANALSAAFEFGKTAQGKKSFMPSRLFLYYNERVLIHTINSDSGAFLRDGIKSLSKQGICPETMWQYVEDKFTQKPAPDCYTKGTDNQILSYHRLDNTNINTLKGCLAEGFPFVFGFTVYDSFVTPAVAKTGIMPMPKSKEKAQGGHAVMAVGYDDAKQVFLVRNSWGTNWGKKGYFTMPYAYISNSSLADDFWTIRLVE